MHFLVAYHIRWVLFVCRPIFGVSANVLADTVQIIIVSNDVFVEIFLAWAASTNFYFNNSNALSNALHFVGNFFCVCPKRAGKGEEGQMKIGGTDRRPWASAGSVSVEQVVLVAAVAIVSVAALIPVGAMLFNYHCTIEFISALPIP